VDVQWEGEARRAFQEHDSRLELVYLSGLPMEELLNRVAALPEHSIGYYLHVFEDNAGNSFAPTDVLERLAASANVPFYGHADTYVGRGIVGGRVFSYETEGANAAKLGLRLLAGENPKDLPLPHTSENTYQFDWRQLQRWGISKDRLPVGSVVRFEEPGFWYFYRWHVIGIISVCVIEALLIFRLLVERVNRQRAEARFRPMVEGLRESQQELQILTGRLMQAQESERRRIARELHDDLNQRLALLAVEIDILARNPPVSPDQFGNRLHDLATEVKLISSSVHDLSHQLHPAKLEHLGLEAALRGLCKEISLHHGMTIAFRSHGVPVGIPDGAALCLYRIVQEAIVNAIKHSDAAQLEVDLSLHHGEICLRIADDGVGFEPSLADESGGLGLLSMRERLRLINGTIAIDTRPSAGTRIEVRVPPESSTSAPGQAQESMSSAM